MLFRSSWKVKVIVKSSPSQVENVAFADVYALYDAIHMYFLITVEFFVLLALVFD